MYVQAELWILISISCLNYIAFFIFSEKSTWGTPWDRLPMLKMSTSTKKIKIKTQSCYHRAFHSWNFMRSLFITNPDKNIPRYYLRWFPRWPRPETFLCHPNSFSNLLQSLITRFLSYCPTLLYQLPPQLLLRHRVLTGILLLFLMRSHQQRVLVGLPWLSSLKRAREFDNSKAIWVWRKTNCEYKCKIWGNYLDSRCGCLLTLSLMTSPYGACLLLQLPCHTFQLNGSLMNRNNKNNY